ncbi:type VI secretion system tip protein VgrG [Aquimarina algicola]|uniref:Type VI secretion system tip protein VgrG n=1 Tax=Aquimarina algicola TaxID=2589995 RepID=A0A504JF11_9FLAO|nr:type VI secretion system tip protein VgrG [Aquimarina algicola]TPN86213.1 type VI secretion system tip protein VgrG [Aquimarina algicola]
MASSPTVDGNDLISMSITSGGNAIPDTYGVMSITITQEVNKIAQAQITIRDGNPTKQMFEIADADTFKTDSTIEISLGYGTDNEAIFSGVVTRQSVRVDDSGTTFQVTCKDLLVKAIDSKSNLVLSDALDSDAITQIASNLGVENDITATTVQKERIIQYHASDWDFIVSSAERNGMVVVTDSGKLVVNAIAVDDDPVLELEYGIDIMEMDVELEAVKQLTSLSINAWDLSSQDVVNSEAREPTVNEQGDVSESDLETVESVDQVLNTSIPITTDEAEELTNSILLKYRMSKYRGSIKFPGSALVKPNTLISLNGLGDLFDGNAYVSAVTHSFSEGNWSTDVQIGISTEWHSQKAVNSSGPEAKGELTGVKGLQVGIVKSIYDENETEYRVQVQIPVLNDDTELVWARLSSFYASNTFGAFFYPEVGDEVILGFIEGNPAYPIILGSMYSSALTPPQEISDANNYIKTLMTKSQLQLQFDDENIVMTMLTPNNNTIVVSDNDQGITIIDENSNQIQMNADGVTINSASSMTITASDDLTIQGSSVTITADNDISVSGNSISASADDSATINGDSECTVSSSGNMNVSGSSVNLN